MKRICWRVLETGYEGRGEPCAEATNAYIEALDRANPGTFHWLEEDQATCHIGMRWMPDANPDTKLEWRRYYVRMALNDEVAALIAEIPGIAEARLIPKDRYSIWIHRSAAFTWAEIHPPITDLLRFCSPVEVNT